MFQFHQPLTTFIFTITFGILSLALGKKLHTPAILFLLFFGVFFGPEFAKLIRPDVFQENFPDYISLLVALILFEGASSLKVSQFQSLSKVLRNLLTVGVFFTLTLAALAAHGIAGLPWKQAILFGAILVVTGPTVVIPVLQRIRIKEQLHNILKWESILIDPLGVIIAVVCFEILISADVGPLKGAALFAARAGVGALLGWVSGWVMYFGLTHRLLLKMEGEELGGLFLLGTNLFFFGMAEWILPESGLVTVTIAGLVIGSKTFPMKHEIFRFRDQVTQFALASLFILLSSNVPVHAIGNVFGKGMLFLAVLIFWVRPIAIFASTAGDKSLTLKDKLFLSFFAPRGIVSASMASLFALTLEKDVPEESRVFLPLAFQVIAGSILFYGFFVKPIARFLGVLEGEPKGILILGANALGLAVAEELRNRRILVEFIDSSPDRCASLKEHGFRVHSGSGFDSDFIETLDLRGIGKIFAVTPNHEVNVLSCQAFSRLLGRKSVFRIWDKTDTWAQITSHSYDESWGMPVLIPQSHAKAGGNYFENEEAGRLEWKRLTLDLKIVPGALKELDLGRPVFSYYEGQIFFASPDSVIPAGREIAFFIEAIKGRRKDEPSDLRV